MVRESDSEKSEEIKEEFCGACVAGLVAVAGAAGAGASVSSKGKHSKKKKILLWSSVIVAIIALIVAGVIVYKNTCKSCR